MNNFEPRHIFIFNPFVIIQINNNGIESLNYE
jgi:hypothetical protein